MAPKTLILYWVFACLNLLLLIFSHADMTTSLDKEKQGEKLVVRGRVYCDLCSAGRVTQFSFFLQGARVVIQCKNSSGNQVLYSEVVSDSNGRFHVNLDDYHDQQVCKFQLRSSLDASCNITTEKSISFVNGSSFEHTMELSLRPLKKPLSCAELSDLYALPPGHLPPNCGPSPPLPIQLPNPTRPSRPIPLLYFLMPPASPALPTPTSNSPPCPKEEILGNNPPPPPPY